MRPRLLALLLLPMLFAVSAPADAQTVSDGTITIVQPKPVLRRMRAQLTPRFGTNINDPYYRQFFVGGTLSFNISERLSLGGTFEWFDFDGVIGGITSNYEQVIRDTETIPEVAPLTWYGGLDVQFVPLYGKMVWFNKIIAFWDFHLLLGGGVVESTTSAHPAVSIGFGASMYINRWFGLTFELRDRFSSEELPSGNRLVQTVTTSGGFTIFLPPNFRYTYDDEGR